MSGSERLDDADREALDEALWGGRIYDDVPAAVERIVAQRVARAVAETRAEALRLVRLVESDMSDQALDAWRSADARRGLSDHDALLTHAAALTRWSERLRMAFDGEDYRADREGQQ